MSVFNSVRATSSKHSANSPITLKNLTRNMERFAPCITPTIGSTARVHEDLRMVATAMARGEEVLLERRTAGILGRVDAMTESQIWEFKSSPDLYTTRAGMWQLYNYGRDYKIPNLTLVVPMKDKKWLRFEAYGQAQARRQVMEWARELGIQLVIAAGTDIEPVRVDEEGYVEAFSFAKQFNVGILQIYHSAELGKLSFKNRLKKKESLRISYHQAKELFKK